MQIGWFAKCLHGYGKEVKIYDDHKTTQEGLFENGAKRAYSDEITNYDVQKDFIAQKILWTLYLLHEINDREQIEKIRESLDVSI